MTHVQCCRAPKCLLGASWRFYASSSLLCCVFSVPNLLVLQWYIPIMWVCENPCSKIYKTSALWHVLKRTPTFKTRKHTPVWCLPAPSGSGAPRIVKHTSVLNCATRKVSCLTVFSRVFTCCRMCRMCFHVFSLVCCRMCFHVFDCALDHV